MVILESALAWLVGQIMTYLLGRAEKAAADKLSQMAEDKKRGEINDANVKAYEEAKDRAARQAAALALLNGDATTP